MPPWSRGKRTVYDCMLLEDEHVILVHFTTVKAPGLPNLGRVSGLWFQTLGFLPSFTELHLLMSSRFVAWKDITTLAADLDYELEEDLKLLGHFFTGRPRSDNQAPSYHCQHTIGILREHFKAIPARP